MKKFLIRACILIIPIAIFIFYMEINLGKIQNNYNYKRKCFENQLDSIQVLVLGTSQAYMGINPDYFALKTFNLSGYNQSLYYDKALTLKYIDKMPKLKYVIISISYFSFGQQLIDGFEHWRDYYYSQYWGIDYPTIDKLDARYISKIFLYIPNVSLTYLKQGFHVGLDIPEYNGYSWTDSTCSSFIINDTTGKNRVNIHNGYYKGKDRYSEHIDELTQLINNLKKRNITPVIITPPVYNTYSKFTDKNIIDKNAAIVQNICNNFNCNYYNYFNDSRFIKCDFLSDDHLNSRGAVKFSKILNKVILNNK